MPHLLIETSTERGLVAVVEKERLLFFKAFPFGYQQSKHLMPEIVAAFAATGVKAQQLSSIIVGVGPGSYTGIRIGAAVAKTLAYAAQVPLVGLCTLEAFIPNEHTGDFAAVIDAKVGGVYCLKGSVQQGLISYSSLPTLYPLEAVGSFLEGVPLLVTPNSLVLKARMEKAFPSKQWEWIEVDADPLHMAKRAATQIEQGIFSKDGSLDLIYLR